MGELVLVRHGETAWSLAGRHTGTTDVALTERGEAQARALGRAFASRDLATVIVSPLARARRTAELAGLVPDAVDPDLVERRYGAMEGLTTAEICEVHPGWWVWSDDLPGGETLAELGARADRVLTRVRGVLDDGAVTGDVLLVGHGHSLRTLTARWLGLEPAAGSMLVLDPASVSSLGSEHGRPAVTSWNLTAPVTG